ncbi:MAG: hypothetical protein ACYTE5_06370 [Planctomycetota bacterium]|jgi:hypothetical protein
MVSEERPIVPEEPQQTAIEELQDSTEESQETMIEEPQETATEVCQEETEETPETTEQS